MQAIMQDRFRGKTWIYWAQFVVCGGLGLFSVIFGALFWTGTMTDANGAVRPQAGPPMVIVGCCLLAVAVLAAFNIVGHIPPIIRCHREGIECNLVGATSLDGVPLVPGLVRMSWTILSLQGFRSQRLRILWPEFGGAQVGGIPMAYVLTLNGLFTNLKTGRVAHRVAFEQVTLEDHPERVADTLNQLAANLAWREQLSSWPSSPSRMAGRPAT
jgi:hypothetical protein